MRQIFIIERVFCSQLNFLKLLFVSLNLKESAFIIRYFHSFAYVQILYKLSTGFIPESNAISCPSHAYFRVPRVFSMLSHRRFYSIPWCSQLNFFICLDFILWKYLLDGLNLFVHSFTWHFGKYAGIRVFSDRTLFLIL